MPPDLLAEFAVPRFARLDDWFGPWAIQPEKGTALLRAVRDTDLVAHVRAAQPAPLKAVEEYQTVKAGPGQQVAVVQLRGVLMKSVGSMTDGTSTVAARRAVRKAAADPEVSAILLAVDSPGGSVSGTADLAADVAAAAKQKPVYAHVADLGASAAYWIASQADKVYANTGTALVGSIGTLAVVYDESGKADRDGVKALVFGTGPLKGAGTPGAPVTDAQQDYFRGLVEDAQRSFDAAVRTARGLTDRQLAAVKTGGVFPAAEALDRKLIDGIQSFDATLTELAAEARRRTRAGQTTRATSPPPERRAAVEETTVQPTVGAAAPTPPAAPPPDPVAAQNAAVAANLERIAGIQRVAADQPALAAAAVRDGWTVARAEEAAMKGRLPNHVQAMGPALISRSHDRDCSLEALQGALVLRARGRLDHPAYEGFSSTAMALPAWMRAGLNDAERNRFMENAHRFSDMSAVDICRESLRIGGRDVPHGRDAIVQAAVSGGTLTSIFTTSVNAVLLATFMEIGDSTQGWTTSEDVADFKSNERIRLKKSAGGLPKLPRGGTADHGKRDDTAESYKIARYAEQFTIDEQDIIDDSLNALADVPVDMAKKAARLRPDLVYAILLANPTLAQTGRALFNSTDGNLGTTSALAAATLKAGISAMTLVQENGVNLNLAPTHLIVPPTLKFTAKELRNSTQIVIASNAATERGSMNTLADEGLDQVTDARLENGVTDPDSGTTYSGSASTWFLASTMAKTIVVGYRRGTGRAPRVRSFVLDKGAYGIGWDVDMDIGAKALEWRGLRKTTA